MAGNMTFTMIKPTAVRDNNIGPILAMINQSGFIIAAMKCTEMSRDQAKRFYAIHEGKPFFEGLVDFMSSGPIVAAILKKKNAVEEFRKLIGNTNPELAEEGTIRKKFAHSIQENAIHGSDSDENAQREADFFFSESERFG